ncbi:MAG TPA: hypothetical protein DDZ42_09235 [Candidatus Rokubacteria bacterium]|nr:MAG: hypothetical protein A2050_17550 [Candidatus Rokubacteria bacterium GWA2_73_35]HBH02086.1 hypothetical protein [Candidatus Rokubacteria bacterium]
MRLRAFVRDERGVALVLALLVLLTLSGLVLAFLSASALEPQISRNLQEGVRARYVAESGLEVAFNALVGANDWSVLLAGASCSVGTALYAGATLPGLGAESGVFTVTVRNDCHAADAAYTGTTIDPGGAVSDTNGQVIVTSVGTVGTATRTISIVARRVALPPFNGALSFPGQEADISFSGASFDIWGTDTNLDGTAGTGQPVYGIAVSSIYPAANPGANESTVESAVAANQKSRIRGKDETAPGTTTTGDNAINADSSLTSTLLQEFIDAARSNADLVLESTPTAPLSFSNIGASCATDLASQTCWGTRDHPKIVYVRGTPPDPSSAFSALSVSGNTTGVGVLIVEDGDFRVSGNFRWEGPIIVTGAYVGVGFLGGGFQEVYGAVVVNETATDEAAGYREGVITGNAKIKYSGQGIDLARSSRRFVSMNGWREQ